VTSPSRNEMKKNQQKEKKRILTSLVQRTLGNVRLMLAKSPVTSAVALSILFGLAVNAVGAIIIWQKYVVSERQRQLEAFAEHNARLAAANVANYMHGAYEKLAFFTKSSSLATALTYSDRVGMLEIHNALKNSFPRAQMIRIFRLGEAKVDLDGDPPLRFAEVDIIRKAERREKVIPEALDVGGGWRINVVVPVPEDATKPVLGTILVTLPIEEVYLQMRKGTEEVGKVSLYQTFNNSPRLMGTFGKGTLFKAAPINVPDSPWQVEFTASEKLYASTQIDYAFLLLVGVVGSLGGMAFFILIGLAIGRQIHRKQQALEETRVRMGRSPQTDASPIRERSILDLNILERDEELLGLDEVVTDETVDPLELDDLPDVLPDGDLAMQIPEHIFRSYDIRGLVPDEISNELALQIGKALGSEALEQGEKALIVARDARTHSPILVENLIRGILSTGCKVINIGTVPTPLLYFATEILEDCSSGVVVTASHNPAAFNGFKVVMKGQVRTEADIKAVRTRILKQNYKQGIGSEESVDVVDRYIDAIFSDVALAGDVTVVIDAGSGVTGKVAPRLFEELGCRVVPLYCDLDGNFPHHGPDPSKAENLQDLIQKVQESGAHLGVAFDGDGDRLAVVTPTGQIIWPDRLLMLFAKDILARNPGADVVFDVKSSRQLNSVISSNGGRPIMWKTGHAPMRAKVIETGALVGGEYSGHIFIKDRWYGFDDGMYAAARLIEIMSLRDESLDEIFAEFPPLCITPEYRVPVPENVKFDLVQRLVDEGEFGEAKLITLDGLRVEFPYGWGLVRASNTGAELTLRFEAESEEQIHHLKGLLTREIRKIDNSIEFRWN
jgi:phosphomannomutase/phosphoglucomutase